MRSFVAVVETRNDSKAATLLGLSQPTVSNHIKRLQRLAKPNPGYIFLKARRIVPMRTSINIPLQAMATPIPMTSAHHGPSGSAA